MQPIVRDHWGDFNSTECVCVCTWQTDWNCLLQNRDSVLTPRQLDLACVIDVIKKNWRAVYGLSEKRETVALLCGATLIARLVWLVTQRGCRRTATRYAALHSCVCRTDAIHLSNVGWIASCVHTYGVATIVVELRARTQGILVTPLSYGLQYCRSIRPISNSTHCRCCCTVLDKTCSLQSGHQDLGFTWIEAFFAKMFAKTIFTFPHPVTIT